MHRRIPTSHDRLSAKQLLDAQIFARKVVAGSKLKASGVVAGTYTLSTVTVNDKGIVTAASSGAVASVAAALNVLVAERFI